MTPKKAFDISDQLARGLDPILGSTTRSESILHHPTVTQALAVAKTALKASIEVEASREGGSSPARQRSWPQSATMTRQARPSSAATTQTPVGAKKGKPWNEYDDKALQSMYRARSSIREMATILGRETGGIISRLERHGLIANRDEGFAVLASQDAIEAERQAAVLRARLTER